MTNLILIVLCLLIGLLLQKAKSLPKDAHLTLNALILFVPLPSVALLTIPLINWDVSLLVLCLAPWILIIFSFLFFRWLGRLRGWGPSVIGCLILTAGLGNTAFIGFPVIEALFGKEALKLAVFLDQPGSFLIVSTLGLLIAISYSSGKITPKDLVRKVIFFPPFVAFTMAIILGALGWSAQGEVHSILSKLAQILTPLALISVGLQLKLSELKLDAKYLFAGLIFKLVLSPLLIYFLYRPLGLDPLIFKVAVTESAMAPMITGSIVAASYGLHPRLAGSMLGLGVPVSFVTLTIWSYLLGII